MRSGDGNHVTWFHPLLAVVYAQYLSADFGIQVTLWVVRYIAGDATLIKDVVDRVDLVGKTQSITTRTVAEKDLSVAVLAAAHKKSATFQAEVVTLKAQLKEKEEQLAARTVASRKAHKKTKRASCEEPSELKKELQETRKENLRLLAHGNPGQTSILEELRREIRIMKQMLKNLGISEHTDPTFLTSMQRRKRK
jgi:hypothetical protein